MVGIAALWRSGDGWGNDQANGAQVWWSSAELMRNYFHLRLYWRNFAEPDHSEVSHWQGWAVLRAGDAELTRWEVAAKVVDGGNAELLRLRRRADEGEGVYLIRVHEQGRSYPNRKTGS